MVRVRRFKIKRKDARGNSQLHRIMFNRHCKLNEVRLLLDLGADVNLQNKYGETALYIAARHYCGLNVITLLLERGALPNIVDNKGFSALSVYTQFDVMKLLLRYGANVNLRNNFGSPVLDYALLTPIDHKLEVIKLLVEHGADLNPNGRKDIPPLAMAIHFNRYNNQNIYKLLLDKGADVYTLDPDGQSLLHIACGQGCKLNLVKLLLARGLDINLTDNQGNSPLIAATLSTLTHLKVFKLLLKSGALVNLTNIDGKSPLYFATVFHCRVDVIELFLNYGAHVNVRELNGVAPLHRAVSNKNCTLGVIKLLIAHGCDVNAVDNFGNNSLHYAVTSTNKEKLSIIKLLLNNGIDLEAIDMQNTSPLKKLMIYSPEQDVIKLFLCYGAQVDVPTNENRAEVLQQMIESCKKDENRLHCVKLIIKYAFLQNNFSHEEIIKGCKNHIVLSSFANACLLEVVEMPSVKVGNLTVDEFVRHKEPKCYINDILIILSNNKYPLYKEIILSKVNPLVLVNKLYEQCVHTVGFEHHGTGKKNVILDFYSACNIAKYLSKNELFNLIVTFHNIGFPEVNQ